MKRLRVLRTLASARKRLRDVAAGELALAEAETLARTVRRDGYQADRVRILAEAPERFLRSTDPRTLLMADEERLLAEYLIGHAEEQRQVALRESQGRRQALGKREAELRVAERVLERALAEREELARRNEQRALDDLSSTRARRGG